MRKNQITPQWKTWTLLGVVLFAIASISYSIYLYQHIQKSKTEGFQDTEQRVLNETELIEIHDIQRFQSEKAYHIVYGSDQNGLDKLLFVPLTNGEEIIIIDDENIMDKQFVEQAWGESCHHCKLIQITPAMIDDQPFWEITYIDNAQRYTFDYVSIYDGTLYEQLQLNQMFK